MNTFVAHPDQTMADEVVLKPRFIFHCLALVIVIAAVVFA